MVAGDLREGIAPVGAPIPLGAKILDAAAVAATGVAITVLLSGGFTLYLGGLPFSSHSVLRPLLVAVALIGVRHATWRGVVPLHARLGRWFRVFQDDPRAAVVGIALTSRVAVLVAGYFAVVVIGFAEPLSFTVSRDPLLNLPARFDAGWYGGIAAEGYEFVGRFDAQQNIAFFPAYPILMRMGGVFTGASAPRISAQRRIMRSLWAGIFISFGAFVWGALYLRRLSAEMIGRDHALTVISLLAAYPFAVYFSAAYTESVFLLGTVAAFFHFRRREWVRASAWGLLVGLTRPNGCLLSVVLTCLIVEHLWKRTTRGDYNLGAAVAAASSPGIGMLAYAAYVRSLTGDWLGWTRVQQAWGRGYEGLPSLQDTIDLAFRDPSTTFDALALLFALLMIWPVFRRLGLAAGAFVLANVLPGMMTGGALSMGRFSSTLFPVFMALALMLPRTLLVPCLVAFSIFQGLVAAMFFTWRPPF